MGIKYNGKMTLIGTAKVTKGPSLLPNYTNAIEDLLPASDISDSERYGWTTVISGDGSTAVSCATYQRDSRGAAYVFVKNGNIWEEQQKLTYVSPAFMDRFGWSAALSSDGNTCAIGMPLEDDSDTNTGAVIIYIRTNGVWTEQQKLITSDGRLSDHFGTSCSLSSDGNTCISGATGDNSTAGSVYVFTRNNGVWSQQQRVLPSLATTNGRFGYDCAISGDGNTFVVGTQDSNKMFIFTRSGNTWTEQYAKTINGVRYARRVSISDNGNTVLAGALGDSTNKGAVYVYTRENGVWTEYPKILPAVRIDEDQFGSDVALSGKGNTFAVGANAKIYIFTETDNIWTEQTILASDSADITNAFGSSMHVSTDGKTTVVGDYGSNNLTGAAYIYTAK